ncbi:MAG: family 10 glycosylhydrolase [Anaerotignum sp.]|nr:family 10 glycosylhydrolase [Anaerotignum sp.]
MNKWMKKLTSGLLCMALGMTTIAVQEVYAADHTDMRAVWISTVYSADYPSVINDKEAQKAEFIEKLDKAQEMGLNTVVVQVRPKGDAFYESELNPWSAVLTGVQGMDPGYDPMEFMIKETHKRGMEFHAWMNPYRITTSGTDLSVLSADHMARKHLDWILTYNNAMYYNPAKEEVKEYICDTVEEIVEKYDVDAIHFDDYFYPSNYPLPEGETRDGATAEERRAHVNDLIKDVYRTIKKADASVEFGISPMGIWKNSTSDLEGSETRGTEGYYSVFGDAKTWVEKGWVDYIVPQIYWEKGNAYADYETLVKWWSDVVKGTGVDLYIGHGIYKDVVASEIAEQLEVNEKYNVSGSFFFSLRDLLNNRQGCADAVKTYYQEADTPAVPVVPEEPEVPVTVEKKLAYAARAKVTVNGNPVEFQTYTIDDYTYFKLRDIASAINGTPKQFMTFWDENSQSIHLVRRAPYTSAGSNAVGRYSDTIATTSTAKLYCDNQRKSVSAYTINDYTYYKLRDIAQLIDMGITWNESTFTIGIETGKSYK